MQIPTEEHNEQFGSINSIISMEDESTEKNMHVIGSTFGDLKNIISRYSDLLNHKHFQNGKIRVLNYFLISF